MTLRQMGGILSNHFPPSHSKLYALRRLGKEVPKVHHTLRKKELAVEDTEKLVSLLKDLQRYVDFYGVFQKYYINLWQKNLSEILNGT